MSEFEGEGHMGVAKPIRPMQIEFENEKDAVDFARWAVSKEKSTTTASQRARSKFKEFRKMKRNSGINVRNN